MDYRYFPEKEMRCHHCGLWHMEHLFMCKLVNLRSALGFPLPVTSGFRCHTHDFDVGGSGNHPLGHCADIKIYGYRAYKLISQACLLGFTGIGVHQRGPMETRYIHIDDLPEIKGRPRPWIWSY